MQGLSDKVKRTRVFRYLRNLEIDIALIQEVHSVKRCHKIFRNEWGGEVIFSDGDSNARGVATLFKRGLEVKIIEQNRDGEGRVLDLVLQIENQTFRLLNVYAPNKDDPEFLETCSGRTGPRNMWRGL